MHQLCHGAPRVAQAIARAIQKEKISSPELQGPKLREAPHPSKRKRNLVVDPSYRPPKSTKRKVDCSVENVDGSDHQPNYDPVQKITTSHAKETARVNEESLDASKRIRVEAVHWEPISHEKRKVDTESSRATSTSTGRVTLTSREIPASSPGRSLPSTAVAKDGSFSPRTGGIQRERIPGGLGITIASSSPAADNTGFKELILSVVKTIYQFCNYQDGLPQDACRTILQSLKKGGFEELKVSSTITLSNMLYIGAWEWFDQQKNRSMGEKEAKTHVLNEVQNRLQGREPQPAAQEKWFSRVETVTLEENASGIFPREGPTSVIARAKSQQRSGISTLLHRGTWLSTKLVKQLGRGILLHLKIW
ncbi:hypothetical protein BDW75DRAFT_235057 [Aspergillus navahoensis]